jgi:hypothetical protein
VVLKDYMPARRCGASRGENVDVYGEAALGSSEPKPYLDGVGRVYSIWS